MRDAIAFPAHTLAHEPIGWVWCGQAMTQVGGSLRGFGPMPPTQLGNPASFLNGGG